MSDCPTIRVQLLVTLSRGHHNLLLSCWRKYLWSEAHEKNWLPKWFTSLRFSFPNIIFRLSKLWTTSNNILKVQLASHLQLSSLHFIRSLVLFVKTTVSEDGRSTHGRIRGIRRFGRPIQRRGESWWQRYWGRPVLSSGQRLNTDELWYLLWGKLNFDLTSCNQND